MTILESLIDLEVNPFIYQKTEYIVVPTDRLYGYKFKEEVALKHYHKVIDYFNKREYDNMLIELEKLEKIVDEKNLRVNIEKIRVLTTELKKKVNNITPMFIFLRNNPQIKEISQEEKIY